MRPVLLTAISLALLWSGLATAPSAAQGNDSGSFGSLAQYRQTLALGRGAVLFEFPSGMAISQAGNLVVVDSGTGWVSWFTPAGKLVGRFAGFENEAFSSAGDALTSRSFFHLGLASDGAGTVYVADPGEGVHVLSAEGRLVRTIGEPAAKMPFAVAVDSRGNLFVLECSAELQNGLLSCRSKEIKKLSLAGALIGTIPGPRAAQVPGPASAQAVIEGASALCIDGSDNLWVLDEVRGQVFVFDSSGALETALDLPAGAPTAPEPQAPPWMAVGPRGAVYVSVNGRLLRGDREKGFASSPATGQAIGPIVVDGAGALWALEIGDESWRAAKYDDRGVLVASVAQSDDALAMPLDLEVDEQGRIHVLSWTGTVAAFDGEGKLLQRLPVKVPRHLWARQRFSVDDQGRIVYLAVDEDHQGARIARVGAQDKPVVHELAEPRPTAVAAGAGDLVYLATRDSVLRYSLGDGADGLRKLPGTIELKLTEGGIKDIAYDSRPGLAVCTHNTIYLFDDQGGLTANISGKKEWPDCWLTTIAIGPPGHIYAVEQRRDDTCRVLDISPDGHLLGALVGTADGKLVEITGLAADRAGNLYLLDCARRRLYRYSRPQPPPGKHPDNRQ